MFVGRYITSLDVSSMRDEPDTEAPIDWGLFFAPTREACIAKLIEAFKGEIAQDIQDDAGSDLVFDVFRVKAPEGDQAGFIEAEYTWTEKGEQVSDERQAWFTVVEARADERPTEAERHAVAAAQVT